MGQLKIKKNEKQYFYNIGNYNYEGSYYTQLSHSKKLSKRKFEEMVIKATLGVVRKCKPKKSEIITFENIDFEIVKELIKKFGFKELKFTAKFDVFGWPNILDENDWKGDRDENLNKITVAIKKNLKLK